MSGATAQSWCPPNALWFHNYNNASIGDFGYVETEYVGNTTIEGFPSQQLVHTVHGYSLQSQDYFTEGPFTQYTTVMGDVVQMWNGSDFDTTFWFGAGPGDFWLPPGSEPAYDQRTTVLDTGHVMVSGQWLKYLEVEHILSAVPAHDTLFERIGFKNMYLDVYSGFLVDGGYAGVRCYSDEDMEYQATEDPCDLILGLEEEVEQSAIQIYPNPCSDLLSVAWARTATNIDISLLDMSGRIIHRWPISGSTEHTTWLPLDGLPEGQYILQLTFKDGVQRTPLTIAN